MHPSTYALVIAGALGLAIAASARRASARLTIPAAAVALLSAIPLVAGTLLVVASLRSRATEVSTSTPTSALLEPPARFEDRKVLGVTLAAPAGWTIRFEEPRRELVVMRGSGSPRTASAVLLVSSSMQAGDADLSQLAIAMRRKLAAEGFRVDAAMFDDRIDGLLSRGIVAHEAETDACTWIVPRGRDVAIIQCLIHDDIIDCREACRPVLQTVRWTAAGN